MFQSPAHAVPSRDLCLGSRGELYLQPSLNVGRMISAHSLRSPEK